MMMFDRNIKDYSIFYVLGIGLFIYLILSYIQKNNVKKIFNEVNYILTESNEKIICYGEYCSKEKLYYSGFASILICFSFIHKENIFSELSMFIMYIIFFIVCISLILFNIYSYGKMIILTDKSIILTSSKEKSKKYISERFKISDVKDCDYRLEYNIVTRPTIETPFLFLFFKDGTRKEISNLSNLEDINTHITFLKKRYN